MDAAQRSLPILYSQSLLDAMLPEEETADLFPVGLICLKSQPCASIGRALQTIRQEIAVENPDIVHVFGCKLIIQESVDQTAAAPFVIIFSGDAYISVSMPVASEEFVSN